MFSESSSGPRAVLQVPCCLNKQGELSENIIQNLQNKLPIQTVSILPYVPDELGDVERVVCAARAWVHPEQEFVEPGQHEGGGGSGAGGVQEAGLGHQRSLEDLRGRERATLLCQQVSVSAEHSSIEKASEKM